MVVKSAIADRNTPFSVRIRLPGDSQLVQSVHDENLHNDYDQDREHDGGYHDKGHDQNDNSNEAFKQLFLTQVHVWLLNL